tara:strand:+ start:6902 stop:7144 length:243 start_codon:yes stop_codon:yes gene_type:complete
MELYNIEDGLKAHPGEYLFHIPSRQMVVCGAFKPHDGVIKALANGRLIEDKIHNFQKVKLSAKERKKSLSKRPCGGCRKR